MECLGIVIRFDRFAVRKRFSAKALARATRPLGRTTPNSPVSVAQHGRRSQVLFVELHGHRVAADHPRPAGPW